MAHNSIFVIMARLPKRAESWRDHLIDWMEQVLNHPLAIFFLFCHPHLLSSLQSHFSYYLHVLYASFASFPLSKQCRIALNPKTINIYFGYQNFESVKRSFSGLGGTHFFTCWKDMMKKFWFLLQWVLMGGWPGLVTSPFWSLIILSPLQLSYQESTIDGINTGFFRKRPTTSLLNPNTDML